MIFGSWGRAATMAPQLSHTLLVRHGSVSAPTAQKGAPGKKRRAALLAQWCSLPVVATLLLLFAFVLFVRVYPNQFSRFSRPNKKLLGTTALEAVDIDTLPNAAELAIKGQLSAGAEGEVPPGPQQVVVECPPQAQVQPEKGASCVNGETFSPETVAEAEKLYNSWTDAYRLDTKADPPASVFQPQNATQPSMWAPHLEECVEAASRRNRTEEFGADGSYPAWACARHNGTGIEACSHPDTPWIQGSDEDNLPLTRRVQRDLWLRQFPRDCTDPSLRFLIVDWPEPAYGIGSQLHLMAIAFSVAVVSNRVLVFGPGTYERASHQACEKQGKRGSLECYFFPVTSQECVTEAQRLHVEAGSPLTFSDPKQAAAKENRVVRLGGGAYHLWGESAEGVWDVPWKDSIYNFALVGSLTEDFDPKYKLMSWWRGQAIRFMLRWPSAYLCHLTNRARQEIYGRDVALRLVAEAAEERRLEQEKIGHIERGWLDSSRNRPNRTALEDDDTWRFPREPYLPRPIISIHVRQGDKGGEMKLYSFPSYMMMAHRVRRFIPNVKNVWLSTEMQSVIDDTKEYPEWNFFYTNVGRQHGSKSFRSYESETGQDVVVATSFVNLLIASQCDMFVGVLQSNWNRLINEMRLTNGRRKANYLALNFDDYRR